MKSKLNKLLPILFLISFAIALYCNTGLFGVTGNSMNPTIKDGDLLFVSKTKHIKYNDILIIDYEKLKTDIVKRVVGLPGDTIKIDKTGFYRNGVKVDEPFIHIEDWWKKSSSVTTKVKEGTVFVLGDNRIESYDSREIGNISSKYVVGVVKSNLSSKTGLSVHGFKLVGFYVVVFLAFWLCIMHRKKLDKELDEVESNS